MERRLPVRGGGMQNLPRRFLRRSRKTLSQRPRARYGLRAPVSPPARAGRQERASPKMGTAGVQGPARPINGQAEPTDPALRPGPDAGDESSAGQPAPG